MLSPLPLDLHKQMIHPSDDKDKDRGTSRRDGIPSMSKEKCLDSCAFKRSSMATKNKIKHYSISHDMWKVIGHCNSS